MEKTVVLAVGNMHCPNCPPKVDKFYRDTPGVLDVDVSLDDMAAEISYDDAVVDEETLLHVLDDTDFVAARMSEDGTSPFLDKEE